MNARLFGAASSNLCVKDKSVRTPGRGVSARANCGFGGQMNVCGEPQEESGVLIDGRAVPRFAVARQLHAVWRIFMTEGTAVDIDNTLSSH